MKEAESSTHQPAVQATGNTVDLDLGVYCTLCRLLVVIVVLPLRENGSLRN